MTDPWKAMSESEREAHRQSAKKITDQMREAGDTLTSIYWRLLGEVHRT